MSTEVVFWRRMNQSIVAQKKDKFFEVPKGSDFGESHEDRKLIADNFDTCPILVDAIEGFSGAGVIERIDPSPAQSSDQEANCSM